MCVIHLVVLPDCLGHVAASLKKTESSRFRFVVRLADDEASVFGGAPIPHGMCHHGDGAKVSTGCVPTLGGLHVAAQYAWKTECPTGQPPPHVPKWQCLVGEVPITRGQGIYDTCHTHSGENMPARQRGGPLPMCLGVHGVDAERLLRDAHGRALCHGAQWERG